MRRKRGWLRKRNCDFNTIDIYYHFIEIAQKRSDKIPALKQTIHTSMWYKLFIRGVTRFLLYNEWSISPWI
jgi:hypothetical protein